MKDFNINGIQKVDGVKTHNPDSEIRASLVIRSVQESNSITKDQYRQLSSDLIGGHSSIEKVFKTLNILDDFKGILQLRKIEVNIEDRQPILDSISRDLTSISHQSPEVNQRLRELSINIHDLGSSITSDMTVLKAMTDPHSEEARFINQRDILRSGLDQSHNGTFEKIAFPREFFDVFSVCSNSTQIFKKNAPVLEIMIPENTPLVVSYYAGINKPENATYRLATRGEIQRNEFVLLDQPIIIHRPASEKDQYPMAREIQAPINTKYVESEFQFSDKNEVPIHKILNSLPSEFSSNPNVERLLRSFDGAHSSSSSSSSVKNTATFGELKEILAALEFSKKAGIIPESITRTPFASLDFQGVTISGEKVNFDPFESDRLMGLQDKAQLGKDISWAKDTYVVHTGDVDTSTSDKKPKPTKARTIGESVIGVWDQTHNTPQRNAELELILHQSGVSRGNRSDVNVSLDDAFVRDNMAVEDMVHLAYDKSTDPIKAGRSFEDFMRSENPNDALFRKTLFES